MYRPLPHGAATVVVPLDVAASVESAIMAFGRVPEAAILESSLHGSRWGRFSILACDPVDRVTVGRERAGVVFDILSRRIPACPSRGRPEPGFPFLGGWIGFTSYEAGLGIEHIRCTTRPGPALPLARFCLYDSVALFDHQTGRWYAAVVDWPAGSIDRPPVHDRLRAVRNRLISAGASGTSDLPPCTTAPRCNLAYEAYAARVDRALRYIAAGDIYQVNLTLRWGARTDGSPLALYDRLRRISPSPYAALLKWGNTGILCSSPELFLDLRHGHVISRPIKGTRPRTHDPPVDASLRADLEQSEKDGAELAMIIDLIRNDLGRVCSYGSVKVTTAAETETHPTVFHRVATIEGDLQAGRDWCDLLRATFPGGSVTGAPKIRAMQIINELEATARGVYCGSIGWIGLDGSMAMNIAIRTMVQAGSAVYLYAGGAIVADSTPENEYQEVMAKAGGMLRAIGGDACLARVARQEATIS